MEGSTLNLTKEAQAVRSLLDKADKLEAEADRKTADASDARWAAAERTYTTIVEAGCTRKAFAEAAGLSPATVTRMVKVWEWWLQRQNFSSENRPTYGSAYELSLDASLEERAAKLGKSPAAQGRYERNAVLATRTPEGAQVIAKDQRSRQQLKRAIRQVEEEEDRAEAEAIRQRALEDAKKSGRVIPDIPPASTGFGANAQMEAGVLLGTAGKSLAAFIKLVRDRGPVPEIAREALLEELDELAGRVQWAREALLNRITDWDDALAKLTGE